MEPSQILFLVAMISIIYTAAETISIGDGEKLKEKK